MHREYLRRSRKNIRCVKCQLLNTTWLIYRSSHSSYASYTRPAWTSRPNPKGAPRPHLGKWATGNWWLLRWEIAHCLHHRRQFHSMCICTWAAVTGLRVNILSNGRKIELRVLGEVGVWMWPKSVALIKTSWKNKHSILKVDQRKKIKLSWQDYEA